MAAAVRRGRPRRTLSGCGDSRSSWSPRLALVVPVLVVPASADATRVGRRRAVPRPGYLGRRVRLRAAAADQRADAAGERRVGRRHGQARCAHPLPPGGSRRCASHAAARRRAAGARIRGRRASCAGMAVVAWYLPSLDDVDRRLPAPRRHRPSAGRTAAASTASRSTWRAPTSPTSPLRNTHLVALDPPLRKLVGADLPLGAIVYPAVQLEVLNLDAVARLPVPPARARRSTCGCRWCTSRSAPRRTATR